MTSVLKDDNVKASERIGKPDRRPKVQQFWPTVAAVLAFLCLAYTNVQHRDAIVSLNEQHADELHAKDEQIARLTPTPSYACREYSVWMEGTGIQHCARQELRM